MIDKQTKQDMAKALGQRCISDKVAQDITLICKNNLTAREALMMRGIDKPSSDTLTDLKKKAETWNLASPSMQKLSHNAAKRILQGKPIIGKYIKDGESKENIILPNGSQVVAVIDMVTKRTEPIRSNESSGDTFNFVQITATQFRDVPQDVVLPHDDNNVPLEIGNNNNDL